MEPIKIAALIEMTTGLNAPHLLFLFRGFILSDFLANVGIGSSAFSTVAACLRSTDCNSVGSSFLLRLFLFDFLPFKRTVIGFLFFTFFPLALLVLIVSL